MNPKVTAELITHVCNAIERYLALFTHVQNSHLDSSQKQPSKEHIQKISDDTEALHQLRVHCRTLLSNLPENTVLIGPEPLNKHNIDTVEQETKRHLTQQYSTSEFVPLKKWLKNVIKQSNAIRDMDVLITETWVSFPKGLQTKLENIKSKLIQSKNDLEGAFCIRLQDEWYPEIKILCISDSAINLTTPKRSRKKTTNNTATESPDKNETALHKTARTKLDKQWETVLEQLKSLHSLDGEALHQIRLKVKKIRYKTEKQDESNKDRIQACKLIQTQLGLFHDQDVALKILKPYLKTKPKLLDRLAESVHDNQQDLLQQLHKKIKKHKRKTQSKPQNINE